MKKILIIIAVVVVLMLVSVTLVVRADGRTITPNTDQDNKTEGWAYAEVVSKNSGNVVLKFRSTRAFESCFEYRTDGDTTQIIEENDSDNDNTSITNSLYPYVCVNNNTKTVTLSGIEYVEIRMVSSVESEEQFDWTRYEVNQPSTYKDQCKNDGWMTLTDADGHPFKNQGQCIKNVNTGNTDQDNKTDGWAYAEVISTNGGNVALKFRSTRAFESCFEYRTDGDTSQIIDENDSVNYNESITDGLYPYVCVNNSTQTIMLSGISYVEIRTVFGDEGDEHFDWTRYDVNQPSTEKDPCKNDGWMRLFDADGHPFKNQGQCIQFVNTGK